MKYMFLLNRLTDDLPAPGTPEFDKTVLEYGEAVGHG